MQRAQMTIIVLYLTGYYYYFVCLLVLLMCYFYLRARNIVLAVVACGDRLKETLNMLKSAIMFTKSDVKFVIICEDKLMLDFKEKV